MVTLINEAENLWRRLQNAQAEAWCDGDWSRARRIEAISERAFWRLVQRLGKHHKQRRNHEISSESPIVRRDRVARVGR